jgi:hypothetical protein
MAKQQSNNSQQQKNAQRQNLDKKNTDYDKYMEKPNHPNT